MEQECDCNELLKFLKTDFENNILQESEKKITTIMKHRFTKILQQQSIQVRILKRELSKAKGTYLKGSQDNDLRLNKVESFPAHGVLGIPDGVINPEGAPKTARPFTRQKLGIEFPRSKSPETSNQEQNARSSKGFNSSKLGDFVKVYNENRRYAYSPTFSTRLKKCRLSEDTSKFTNTQIKELSKQKQLQSCFSQNEIEKFK